MVTFRVLLLKVPSKTGMILAKCRLQRAIKVVGDSLFGCPSLACICDDFWVSNWRERLLYAAIHADHMSLMLLEGLASHFMCNVV